MRWPLLLLPSIAFAHDASSAVTWSREISRLTAKHCASCHREGGSSFSLATFNDVKPRAKSIAEAVQERRMPPFGAVKGFSDLRDDSSLTQEQIELFSTWVQAGAPEGDPTLALKAPAPTEKKPPPHTGPELLFDSGKNLARPMTIVAVRAKTLSTDSVRVVARKPDGSIEPLVWFYKNDLKQTYYFRKPIWLPAGTKIVASTSATVALLPVH